MDRTQLLQMLRLRLRDVNDQRWTSSEKEDALDAALRDKDVVQYTTDNSITAVAGTQRYPLTGALAAAVQPRIYELKILANNRVVDIPQNQYSINAGELYFRRGTPLSGTFLITFAEKVNNNINQEYVELVMNLAAAQAFEMLLAKGVSHFLTNDTTPQEVIGAISFHRNLAERDRSSLSNKEAREF